MIVYQYLRCRIRAHGIPEQLSDPHLSLIDTALVDGPHRENSMPGVEQHHPKLLVIQCRQFDAEELEEILRTVYGESLFGRRRRQPASKFEGSLDLACFRLANAPRVRPVSYTHLTLPTILRV